MLIVLAEFLAPSDIVQGNRVVKKSSQIALYNLVDKYRRTRFYCPYPGAMGWERAHTPAMLPCCTFSRYIDCIYLCSANDVCVMTEWLKRTHQAQPTNANFIEIDNCTNASHSTSTRTPGRQQYLRGTVQHSEAFQTDLLRAYFVSAGAGRRSWTMCFVTFKMMGFADIYSPLIPLFIPADHRHGAKDYSDHR